MRILNSDFKDFYDSCAVQTPDEKPVYIRKSKIIQPSNNGDPAQLMIARVLKAELRVFSKMPWEENFGEPGLLGFCGKLYPFWQTTSSAIYPTLEGLLAAVEREPFESGPDGWNKRRKEEFDTARASKTESEWGFYRWTKADLTKFFTDFRANIGDQVFIELGVPVFAISEGGKVNGKYVELNSCLKSLGFDQLMKPFAAYQELDTYLGNNLATRMDPEAKGMTDKLRAETHGFDKWSFRTHKEDAPKLLKKKQKQQEAKVEQEKKVEAQKSQAIADEVREMLGDN